MGFLIFITSHTSCDATFQMMKTEAPVPHAQRLPDRIRQMQGWRPLVLRPQDRGTGLGKEKEAVGLSRSEGLEEGPEQRTKTCT